MSFFSRLLKTLQPWRRRRDEISEELEFHRAEMERAFVERGLPPEEARRRAAIRFGSQTRLVEETREQHVVATLEEWARDTQLAFRSLARRPLLTATALASLAVGIGATSAFFSVADAVLLKPLPLPHPDRLVALQTLQQSRPSGGNPQRIRDVATVHAISGAFLGYYSDTAVWSGPSGPSAVTMLRVTGDYAATLATVPQRGRYFSAAECESAERVAIVHAKFWRSKLGAKETLPIPLTLEGVPFSVIGVSPDSPYFDFADIIVPAPKDYQGGKRDAHFLSVFARLRDAATYASVQSQLDVRMSQLAEAYPATDRDVRILALPLQQAESAEVREPLLLLFGAVGSLLLIACVNVSGLLLGRAIERSREAAIRRSLGAGAIAVLRTYLLESLLLAMGGAGLGLLVAANLVSVLKAQLPAGLVAAQAVALDWRTAAFAVAAALLSGLFASWAPAWQATRAKGLAVQERGGTTPGSSLRLRHMISAAQITVSVSLLAVAILLARSFFTMAHVPLGPTNSNGIAAFIDYPWSSDISKVHQFSARAQEELATLPGVKAAAVLDRLPLDGGAQSGPVQIRDRALDPRDAGQQVSRRGVSQSAFSTLRWPLRKGRVFGEPRGKNNPREVVVSETFANRFFPFEEPLGKRISFAGKGNEPEWYEITGVCADLREQAEVDPLPQVFVPLRSVYWPLLRFVVTTDGPPEAISAAVRQTLLKLDPVAPIQKIVTLESALGEPLEKPRLQLTMLGAFSGFAIGLALLGLYGLMAAEVARRRRELGVRLALGAEPSMLVKALTRRGIRLAFFATVAGLGVAFGLTRYVESLLVGVTPLDPWTYAAALAIALVAAALASWLPARRAARVDPVEALRHE